MSGFKTHWPKALRVIQGGATDIHTQAATPHPVAPKLSASELAADMAELFAMALLRDCTLSDVMDPHHRVALDSGFSFTLHELLCELRNLPWFDGRAGLAPTDREACSRASSGDAGHRRAMYWNDDGQLTLRTLFRSGVALPRQDSGLSQVIGDAVTASQTKPTLGKIAQTVHTKPAEALFCSAANDALARGAAFDRGLAGFCETASQVLALIATAEQHARLAALTQIGKADRLTRPGVTGARMTVHLAREERNTAGRDGAAFRAAADELALHAPNLVEWVSRANTDSRRPLRFAQTLFLPLGYGQSDPLHPSDSATHCVVAGAMGTILKAVFADGASSRLRMVDGSENAPDLHKEIDLLASNITLGRTVGGGYYPAESHHDLRFGEVIGLQILRKALMAYNGSARLTFRDFDGRQVALVAHPRSFDSGHVELWRDGATAYWPADRTGRPAHLTAVV